MGVFSPTRILIASLLAMGVIIGGTLGYVVIEGWTFLESFYMSAITVTTVGFQEVKPLSPEGRVFTSFLIFFGVGTVLYIMSSVTQSVVEGKLRDVLGRRTLERKIRALKGHYIICGYGRIGHLVSDMLLERGKKVVVIENHPETLTRMEEEGTFFVSGSATEDESLLAAGIDRAAGLLAAVSSDADNVYIVLSAKGMRKDLFVIARATEPGSERKLRRAGADKVVSPYFIGARRIAQTVIRPSVADFIDLTFHSSDIALQMEELRVGDRSEIAGVSLKDSGIRQKMDVIILAIKKADGRMIFNPQATTVLERQDTVIAMGPRDSMHKLAEVLNYEF
jgi:voltage-gated potassium channel